MTREQSGSELWWEERKNILTASNFAKIYHRKKQNCDKFLDNLQGRGKTQKQTTAMQHGHDCEYVAARKYSKYMFHIGHSVHVLPCGLVQRPDMPTVGASPDRRVLDPKSHAHYGIIEIKCPYKYRCITPREATQSGDKDFCLEMVNDQILLKRGHAYYMQVQGQMALCGAQWCDFVVYTFKGMHIERISFDEQFWIDMYQKLCAFYFRHFLPSLAEHAEGRGVKY